jgi:hypothetical protein
MKLAMTAVMPSGAFTDEHECMKIAKHLLSAMRKQMTAEHQLKGQMRLSILLQNLEDKEPDRVGQAVREALNG